ncbi:MAG: hypothetical protein JSV03_05245 [Planctomycetota bacterium]|nr:MAG: hypothetical protein JSV03_05245 [Planctomycetota bacterium]
MSRAFLAVLILIAPFLALLTTVGCGEKTVIVTQEEQRRETTPEMVSPGEEVVE